MTRMEMATTLRTLGDEGHSAASYLLQLDAGSSAARAAAITRDVYIRKALKIGAHPGNWAQKRADTYQAVADAIANLCDA